RTFETSQDWTPHGVKSLVLYFQGTSSNTGGNFYVKINDTKVVYDGDTASLMRGGWNKWVILLGDVPGVNLSGVRSLTLGVEGGGAGVVYVDDITLTPVGQRDLVTPTEPGGGLVLHLPFDGDYQDVSGNGLHGTPMGLVPPAFEAGHMGQAASFDGIDQYVEITGYQGILGPNPFSITTWINTSGDGTMVGWGSTAGGVTRVEFRIDQGRLRCESSGNVQGDSTLPDNEWIHVAVTVIENAVIDDPDVLLYLNGRVDNRPSTGATNPLDMAAGFDVTIGRRHSGAQRWFPGSIDDVRIYDRALSSEEIAGAAGRTAPFDQ
ncbi:MAG: LamG domain-containing protein, partial [Planctomycetes bacterium]|nr:LamG domain-containing protein [Planctomycetota bacterium]